MGSREYLEPIYCAYEKEEQQFVKSSYLAAMENFDCRQYIDRLKARLDVLSGLSVTAHQFVGWEENFDVVLLTNRNCAEVTGTELLELVPDAKSAFVKKVSGHLEKLSERKLVNTTSNYEIELRLIEDKDGNCNLLVKLFTIKDHRFTYRKEVMPTSLKPVDAALTVALAKQYMKEGAQVMDPFCGGETIIIERHLCNYSQVS